MLGAIALAIPAFAGLATATSDPAPLALRNTTPIICSALTALVSPWWLHTCQSRTDLIIIDLRSADAHAQSHIPGSKSIPFAPVSAWSETSPTGLLLEMPPSATVRHVLASIGVRNHGLRDPASKFVLVNDVAIPPYPQADSARVAATLKYVGIPMDHVAILDGGYQGWTFTTTTTTAVPTAAIIEPFTAIEDNTFLVNKTYVATNLHKKDQGILLLDARDKTVYNGSTREPWSPKPGHIPSALSLPAENIWNPDGTYKPPNELRAQLLSVGIQDSSSSSAKQQQQIILYCGVGGYASSWYFVLTRLLRYDNVVLYDGSAQEWSMYFDMEL